MSLPLTLHAYLITLTEKDEIHTWSLDSYSSDADKRKITELKGQTVVQHTFEDSSPVPRGVAAGPSSSPFNGADLASTFWSNDSAPGRKAPSEAFWSNNSAGLSRIVEEDAIRDGSADLGEMYAMLGLDPSLASQHLAQQHQLTMQMAEAGALPQSSGQSHPFPVLPQDLPQGNNNPGSVQNSSVAQQASREAAAAAAVPLRMMEHDFEFANVEFVRPTRMTKVRGLDHIQTQSNPNLIKSCPPFSLPRYLTVLLLHTGLYDVHLCCDGHGSHHCHVQHPNDWNLQSIAEREGMPPPRSPPPSPCSQHKHHRWSFAFYCTTLSLATQQLPNAAEQRQLQAGRGSCQRDCDSWGEFFHQPVVGAGREEERGLRCGARCRPLSPPVASSSSSSQCPEDDARPVTHGLHHGWFCISFHTRHVNVADLSCRRSVRKEDQNHQGEQGRGVVARGMPSPIRCPTSPTPGTR